MPWYDRIVPDSVKKSVCAYLVQRYLGDYFEEKLSKDQLDVDLYNGRGTVEKISLDVQALNQLGEKQNWPMEFVDGYIEKLDLTVPWASLLQDPSYVEATGLKLTLQPKQRNEYATSMLESMWNSMSSSMKLAEDLAKQKSSDHNETYEGIEIVAKAIDSILRKVQVKFINTVIQIEHVPKDSNNGVGIVINIDLIQYCDEAGNDPSEEEATDLTTQDGKKAYIVEAFSTKKFNIEGIRLSTVEFLSKARTFSRSMINSEIQDDDNDESFMTIIDKNSQLDEKSANKSHLDAERHVILFAKFSKSQEVRVRLKQSENITGPKVSFEVNLGSVTFFLSPRQVHVLSELINGLASPDLEDTSNVPHKTKCVEKPMTTIDYMRVEQELQQQLLPQAGGLKGIHGWSAAGYGDESDSDDIFLPMKNNSSGMYDSTLSGVSSSMESSFSSSMASSFTEQSTKVRRRANNIDTDPTAEISHFQIRIASAAVLILHEDILTLSTVPSQILVTASVEQMQSTVESFFQNLGQYALTAYGVKDFENSRDVFEKACQKNHLRLLAAPIQIEADEKTTHSSFSITGQLTAAKIELLECLYSNSKTEHIALLAFNDVGKEASCTKPCFKASFKHVEKTSRSAVGRRVSGPKTDLSIYLNKGTVDFDITIVDRITALLNPQPVCIIDKSKKPYNPWSNGATLPNIQLSQTELRTDVKVTSPLLIVKLRFPVPDFRPPHDMNRTPWWSRHVRPDYLAFTLCDVTFKTFFQTNQVFQEFSLESRLLDLHYWETEGSAAVHIAKVGHDEQYQNSLQDILQHPRLSIKLYPIKKEELDEPEPEAHDITSSLFGGFSRRSSGPFSAKKVVHESDTPHNRSHTDDEELIIPGDKGEIEEFIKSATSSARIQVDIILPTVSMQLASKHIYEVIYNRINNDLLLWEPSAPKPKMTMSQFYDNINLGAFANLNEGTETFTMCKSGIQYYSDSDSDDGSGSDSGHLFFSTCDKMKHPQKPPPVAQDSSSQSHLVLNLHIGRGVASLNTPVRDVASNVIPGQHGEFHLNIADANVFVVSGFKGDEDLGYVCVQLGDAFLYHSEMISTTSEEPTLKDIGVPVGRHLHPTIYKSERGMSIDNKRRGGKRELATVAVKIQAKHETHHVKTVKVAVGLNKATLRHKMCNEPNSWISHLLDFFNVRDYPIPGYNAKEVLTELHLHLWDCAIDYRPLYLPLRTAVTVGNFSMSSHLSEKSNTSTLRFIAEDCGLFLSDRAPPRNGVPSFSPVDLRRDYVNVIEVGLFELSLRTNDKKSGINPHIDLRASNDVIHIHTCADSGRSLTQLLTYFANDGDLPSANANATDDAFSSPSHRSVHQELVSVEQPQDISKLSQSQHQKVNDLLGEAMQESLMISDKDMDQNATGAKLFLFPDENNAFQDVPKPLPQVKCELGDITLHSNKGNDTDDEFCFIGDEAGLGLFPKNGIPEIKWLTSDAVRVADNHFSIPVGRSDLLKPPKGFPTPTMRYTLCEMNLIWHMYGGNDFKSSDDGSRAKKTVNFSDVKLKNTVSFSNAGKGEVSFSVEQKPQMSWLIKGGVNRDHNVLMELELNKVRFQHETYPETTIQASRQVLLISELEVRDRLASSQINKFLYQYTSQARPKQSHAHMIVIKAVHIRPDPKLNTEECCLKVSLLPLRLNIDQDALLFLINFFNELGGSAKDDDSSINVPSKNNTPTHQPPVMTVSRDNEDKIKEQAHKIVDENLLILLEENKLSEEPEDFSCSTRSNPTESPPIYFRNVLFSPDVPIRLDYHGKHVDMTHGSLAGLLMGLGQLNCSELRLKRISHRHGLLGFDKLMAFLLQEWLNDIKKNQLPSLLGGVGPMYSLVQLFQGIRDLFWLPIEQYQKDGRIVRGLQRGANSFTTSTAMAALELTSRIIHLIQLTAETAYDMLSPGPSVKRVSKTKGKKKRYNQPQDIREGVANAYMLVKEGIGETAGNIVQVASHEHEQKGYSGAVGGVLRQIPPTILKPIIIASEATSNVLGGMRSQLVPDARREANQKWRNNDT